MYVEDNLDLTIHDLNCVPSNRPKGSWTNGVKANSKDGSVSGWFYPPRAHLARCREDREKHYIGNSKEE